MLDKILSFIADHLGINHITEEGKTSAYSYRKWANGEIELWFTSSYNPGKGYGIATITLPVALTDNNYTVMASKTTAGSFCVDFGVHDDRGDVVKTNTNFKFAIRGAENNAYAIGFEFYVKGRWK